METRFVRVVCTGEGRHKKVVLGEFRLDNHGRAVPYVSRFSRRTDGSPVADQERLRGAVDWGSNRGRRRASGQEGPGDDFGMPDIGLLASCRRCRASASFGEPEKGEWRGVRNIRIGNARLTDFIAGALAQTDRPYAVFDVSRANLG